MKFRMTLDRHYDYDRITKNWQCARRWRPARGDIKTSVINSVFFCIVFEDNIYKFGDRMAFYID